MNVLIACECSGEVRRAFSAMGHNAFSCDLLPAEDGGPHLQCDAVAAITAGCPAGGPWHLIIMHPPCTYLSLSGIHWNSRRPERAEKTARALDLVRQLINAAGNTPYCLENPMSIISSHVRPKDQTIQPYQFGHDAMKTTWLWLSGLPPLTINPADRVAGRWVCHKGKMVERWSNQTDAGQNRLTPSETRAADRARTYSGIARAMATQWGNV